MDAFDIWHFFVFRSSQLKLNKNVELNDIQKQKDNIFLK